MHFDSDNAYRQLSVKGRVATLRKGKVGERAKLTNVNVRIFRHGKDTGLRANILLIRHIEFDCDDSVLENYLPISGFSSIKQWKDEAIKLSGKQMIWRLYVVILIS